MSKLRDTLKFKRCGRRCPGSTNTVELVHNGEVQACPGPKIVQEYLCHATLSVKLDGSRGWDEYERFNYMRWEILHEIFGEFRAPLQMLRSAVFEGDKDKALEILNTIKKSMFSA